MAHVIIVDGPEAAGKSTLIARLWPRERVRRWGPVDSIKVYEEVLTQDLMNSDRAIIVWDRSWASEVVYNELLGRGRQVEPDREYLEEYVCLKLMVLADPMTLILRRQQRVNAGQTDDLPVEPYDEHRLFLKYAKKNHWAIIAGDS